jgi:RHS repeat-associated protein
MIFGWVYPLGNCCAPKKRSSGLTNDGCIVGSTRYKPWGEERQFVAATAGSTPTDFRFTGQRKADVGTGTPRLGPGIYDYNARFYDATIGRFLSADTIVPEPGDPQSFNRYSYALNAPTKYTDPSGHDPIDSAWESDFTSAHGRAPTDIDRQDRIFSLLFKGSGSNGAWTSADWAKYGAYRDAYWKGTKAWNGQRASGVDSFVSHIDTLASYYSAGEESEFVAAIGLTWGGIPYVNRFSAAWSARGGPPLEPLFEGNSNWIPQLLDTGDQNQSHHWAGLFYMGFFFEAWVGQSVNVAREINQWPPNTPDITLGSIAVNQGRMLGARIVNMSEVGSMLQQTIDARPAIWPPNSPGSRSLTIWDYIP